MPLLNAIYSIKVHKSNIQRTWQLLSGGEPVAPAKMHSDKALSVSIKRALEPLAKVRELCNFICLSS